VGAGVPGVVICLERGADLHMAQLMPLPLTVSFFSKIKIGFTFLVPAHPGSPGQRAVKRACVCVWYSKKNCSEDLLQVDVILAGFNKPNLILAIFVQYVISILSFVVSLFCELKMQEVSNQRYQNSHNKVCIN